MNQHLEGVDYQGLKFTIVFPATFELEGNKIPEEWMPQVHCYYEDRIMDVPVDDALPKFIGLNSWKKSDEMLEHLKAIEDNLMIDKEKGQCICGKVQFYLATDSKPLWSVYYHGKEWTHQRSTSPVHVLGVDKKAFSILCGTEYLKVCHGKAKMQYGFCTECGTTLYQHQEGGEHNGVEYVGLFPANFLLEGKIPAAWSPQAHLDYENRLMDVIDPLPKFIGSREKRCGNDGNLLNEGGVPSLISFS